VVRIGLRTVLDAERDIDIVGEAGTAADAIRMVGAVEPDIVLMDVRLPDDSGLVACRRIREQWPNVQVLMLTSYADPDMVIEAINACAAGYVLKQLDTRDLLKAIRDVGAGRSALDPAVTGDVLDRVRKAEANARSAAFAELSAREVEVLAQVAQGRTNAEIAESLFLSEKTARNHVSAILAKLGLANRIEAATFAVRNHVERYVRGNE
jgi:DNA-binding NarL/FixJ family response regulator